ncbi:MAG: 50S ribosomal protein L25 [Pirellulales bacterium]|nr:50S ribosomal protein L25 [Pirellulales bacterium]
MTQEVESLHVKRRTTRGTSNARRLRAAGSVPAVLYGHGEETVSIAVPATELSQALRHGSKFVDLAGDLSEKALLTDIQWDVWGNEVLHVDFTRVSADEKVQIQVPVELRGEAPGSKENGVVAHLIHEVTVECAATQVPEKIEVNINHLELDQQITVGDLKLPEGVTLDLQPEAVVVQCVPAQEEQEEEEVSASSEPEIIGRSESEEGGGSE